MKAEEGKLEGQLIKVEEEWHKTERTLSTTVMPVVNDFLGLISGGVKDLEEFVKGTGSLTSVLGALGMVGAGGFSPANRSRPRPGGCRTSRVSASSGKSRVSVAARAPVKSGVRPARSGRAH